MVVRKLLAPVPYDVSATGSIFIVTNGDDDFSKLDCRFSLSDEEPKLFCLAVRPKSGFLNEPSFDVSAFNPRLPDNPEDPSLLLDKADDCPSLLDKVDDVVKLLVKFDDKPKDPVKPDLDGPSRLFCKPEEVSFVSLFGAL